MDTGYDVEYHSFQHLARSQDWLTSVRG